jgi:YHS domain-containing protein
MKKSILIFLGTFIGGALIALVARAAKFNSNDASSASQPAPVLTAAANSAPQPNAHAQHDPKAEKKKPVNTVCAICGMDVDPSLPTAEYKGQTIGFGCRMCPPKFKANPDKYGPAYLRNEVLEK